MDDEARLIEALLAIEAMFAGSTNAETRAEAERVREEIRRLLHRRASEDTPVEYKFTMADVWSRKLFLALLRRYDIKPYRYRRQRHTTVMARVPRRFVDETLWPEFTQLSERLRLFLDHVTDRIVSQVLHEDFSEAEVVDEQANAPSPETGRLLPAPPLLLPPAPSPPAPPRHAPPAGPGPAPPARLGSVPAPAPAAAPSAPRPGRNDPCPCGSGKKYKKCCGR